MATNVVRSLMTIMTCIKVKNQQRRNVIIYVIWPPHLIRCTLQVKNDDDLHEGHLKIIKGQIVNHAIWLSNFVRNTTESSWGQSCPQ